MPKGHSTVSMARCLGIPLNHQIHSADELLSHFEHSKLFASRITTDPYLISASG